MKDDATATSLKLRDEDFIDVVLVRSTTKKSTEKSSKDILDLSSIKDCIHKYYRDRVRTLLIQKKSLNDSLSTIFSNISKTSISESVDLHIQHGIADSTRIVEFAKVLSNSEKKSQSVSKNSTTDESKIDITTLSKMSEAEITAVLKRDEERRATVLHRAFGIVDKKEKSCMTVIPSGKGDRKRKVRKARDVFLLTTYDVFDIKSIRVCG